MKAKTNSGWHFDPDNLTVRGALIIAAGFFLVGGIFIPFGHGAGVKFGGLTLGTILLFGYFAQDSQASHQNARFWILTAFLLVLHLAAWVILLMHVEKWGLLWFNIMVFELPVFWHLRDRSGLLN
ncbi:MAG: hypothetical protein WCA11_10210 [Terracidiphilus sp.]